MATLTQFRSELAAVLGLTETTAGDQTMMDFYVNEGVSDVLLRTHCKVLPFEMSTTAGEGDYTLPAGILVVIELEISTSSAQYVLDRMTPAEVLRLRRNNDGSDTSRAYATSGANLLMLYPIPSGVDTITGLYVPRPTTLSGASDTPSEIPAEWHKAVSFYALARAADMDDDSTSEQGERYRGLYEQAIARMRYDIYVHGGTRMAPARLNPRRRYLVPHDPSTDR